LLVNGGAKVHVVAAGALGQLPTSGSTLGFVGMGHASTARQSPFRDLLRKFALDQATLRSSAMWRVHAGAMVASARNMV
jgi:hypothetical protein